MSSASLIVEYQKNVCSITLNRPQQHNAFDDQLIASLQHTLDSIAQDLNVRVVILKAAAPNFCAGADLKWMQNMVHYTAEENYADSMKLAMVLKKLATLPKATIAQVQGASFGGGVGLIACCDIAIAAPNATFCLSEVKLGLIPAVISPYLIAAMGARAAKRYFITAEIFDAISALQLNLIHEICNDDLSTRVHAIAETICRNGPHAVIAAKQLVNDVSQRTLDEHLISDTARRIATIRVSDEGQEGLKSFLEKRPAHWTLRDGSPSTSSVLPPQDER